MKSLMMIAVLAASFSSFAGDGKVTISVSLSPAGSFQAVSDKAKGIIVKKGEELSSDKISLSIQSLKTGIDLRDEHFWKHLKSEQYAKAVLSNVKASAGKGSGILEINGVKKPVAISYSEKESDIIANFKVKASEFNLSKAQYLGVGVEDDIAIEAVIGFVKK